MKKNNKGFTLVELIAVIALLGILAMFAIPRLYSLITDSKKNVYIEDAIRLITQAQYAMSSKSVKIDKPDAGECIVISMKYLNSGDFQNPPNGGSYLPESSFVIVKNVGGDYVYSAMLVERLKDGSLMGVELSTESALNAKNAIKHVRVFRDDEIAFINEDGGIDAGFINGTINVGDDEDDDDDYVEDDDKIIGFYNEEHEDEEIVIDTSIPKFTAKFSSSGTLQTTLSISASDADNAKEELKVCLKISDNSNDTYPDPTVQADVDEYCEGYGTGAFFTKNIDFSLAENGGFTYESKKSAYVYIAVFDPNNNVVRKKMTYDIHENEPPVISLFTINHHPDDSHNMPRSRFVLSLFDDMDNQENLQICFLQDDLYGTCADSDFKPYSYFFGPTNIYDYTFKDSNGMGITYPDGSHHNVTVFVKDSMGEMVRETAYYNLYQNAVPTININSIVPECLFKKADGSCSCNNCNSLTFTINMTITDDITPAEDVQLTFYEKDAQEHRLGEVSMTYGQYLSGNKKYSFSGGYDGQKRVLHVDAVDEYGGVATTYQYTPNVYRDQAPNVVARKDANGDDIPFIQSAGDPCNGFSTCTDRDNGGSYDVILTFDAVDDLATVSGIKVCFSEESGVCTAANLNTSNFINYSEMNPQFSFSFTGEDPSQPYPNNPQITKKLYVALADDQGHVREYSDGWNYKLYKNYGPVRTGGYSIQTTDTNPDPNSRRNLMTVRFLLDDLRFADDFDNYQARLCYTIRYTNGTTENVCDPYYNYAELFNALSDSYEFKDSHGNPLRYNVDVISTSIHAKDNYNDTADSDTIIYRPAKDDSPVIIHGAVSSIAEQYNSYIVNVEFKVRDPHDTYTVCVTTGDTCTEDQYLVNSDGYPFEGGTSDDLTQKYTITVDGNDKFNWPVNYQDTQGERSFNLIVKDSYGKTDKKTLKYTLYQLCSDDSNGNLTPTQDDITIVYDNSATEGREISTSYCQGECYHNYKTTTNTTHINYLTRTNDLFGHYKKTIQYMDNHVNLTCPIVSDETLYCDSSACFDTFVDGGASENPNLIALELKQENLEWYYTNERVKRRVPIDKPYCRNIDSSTSYFYHNDYRCTTPNFCGNKATLYCNPIVEAAVAENDAAKQAIDEEYARLEAIYAFEEEEALKQYLIAAYMEEDAPIEEPTDTPSPTDTGDLPDECVQNPAICECIIDMSSHDDCPFILSCVDPENTNKPTSCACVLDPQGDTCACLNDPTGDGCTCLLDPDGFACGCENDPDGEFCQCLDDPEAEGCEDFELPEPDPDPEPDPEPDPDPDPDPSPSIDPTPDPSPSDDPEPDPAIESLYPEGFGMIPAINTCSGVIFHMNDSTWKTETYGRCSSYFSCAACVGDHSEACTSTYGEINDIGNCDTFLQDPAKDSYACSSFYSNDTMRFTVEEQDIGICDLLETYVSENRATFITNYEQSHPYPQKPPYPSFSEEELRASCETEYKNRCNPFYSFCNNTNLETYKTVVPCSQNPDITPVYCRVGETEIEDGLCLETDNTCLTMVDGVQIPDEEHCREVCYKTYNCQEEYEIKPVVFTCHGYFETYRSTIFQGNIKLERQENIICPDFYRLYPQFFAYNDESTTPFIKFNPAEVGGQ